MKVGKQAKILTPQNWNRYFSVFGALNPITGESIFETFDRKNGKSFIIFMESILKSFIGIDLYLVVDRATYHRSKEVNEWLSKNLQIHLIYLPPRSPQLNPVEGIWRWLKDVIAANRTYADLEPLKIGCMEKLSSLTTNDLLRIAGLKHK